MGGDPRKHGEGRGAEGRKGRKPRKGVFTCRRPLWATKLHPTQERRGLGTLHQLLYQVERCSRGCELPALLMPGSSKLQCLSRDMEPSAGHLLARTSRMCGALPALGPTMNWEDRGCAWWTVVHAVSPSQRLNSDEGITTLLSLSSPACARVARPQPSPHGQGSEEKRIPGPSEPSAHSAPR